MYIVLQRHKNVLKPTQKTSLLAWVDIETLVEQTVLEEKSTSHSQIELHVLPHSKPYMRIEKPLCKPYIGKKVQHLPYLGYYIHYEQILIFMIYPTL